MSLSLHNDRPPGMSLALFQGNHTRPGVTAHTLLLCAHYSPLNTQVRALRVEVAALEKETAELPALETLARELGRMKDRSHALKVSHPYFRHGLVWMTVKRQISIPRCFQLC